MWNQWITFDLWYHCLYILLQLQFIKAYEVYEDTVCKSRDRIDIYYISLRVLSFLSIQHQDRIWYKNSNFYSWIIVACIKSRISRWNHEIWSINSSVVTRQLCLQLTTIRAFKSYYLLLLLPLTVLLLPSSSLRDINVDKTETLKKEKEKNIAKSNEQKQVKYSSCRGSDHTRFFSKLCLVTRQKRSFQTLKIQSRKLYSLCLSWKTAKG